MFKCLYSYFNEYFKYYRTTYRIAVNVNNRTLTLYKDNKVFKTYLVAIGKPSTPTPRGTFRIKNKQVTPGGPFGVRWMGLTAPGIGIHGTNNPSSIGKAVSNGCIRMFNKDVIEVFNLVPVGTIVSIV